ncbi:MAG: DUF3327 domain-containing protein [Microbacterium sp.]|jgi:enterochelin esterase family protein|nr:DUF3327 domain-containing protein [Microbacterium sp.]
MNQRSSTPRRAISAAVTTFAARWDVARTADERRLLEEDFNAAHPTNPVLGALHTDANGERLVETTFLWRLPPRSPVPHDVMIHLNSVTDAHRDDITPALMTRIRDSSFWELTYLLPDDLCASYRVVVGAEQPIPRLGGAERSSWLRIHEQGRPDPRGVEQLPNPLGTHSSVMTSPRAQRHPVWGDSAVVRGSSLWRCDVPTVGGAVRTLHVYRPHGDEPPRDLLVLFDGDVWRAMGVQDALDRWSGGTIAAVLVSSVSPERRAADLPHPGRIARILREEVLPVTFRELGKNYLPAETIVSGQSYGGLASAALVAEHPDIATRAIAQSPSFHFRAAEEPRRPDGQRGDVSSRLARTTATGRIVMTAGTNEDGLLDQARIARDDLATTPLRLDYREFTGGHDYAWWRHGLFWGLDVLFERPEVNHA